MCEWAWELLLGRDRRLLVAIILVLVAMGQTLGATGLLGVQLCVGRGGVLRRGAQRISKG